MIKSGFISDIMNLLLDGEEDSLFLRNQLPFLTESEYEYTGAGVFVSFSYDKGINNFKLNKDKFILSGVEIKSPELEIGAETILFTKDGFIDFLEIFSYDGNYPRQELKNYVLTQIWDGSPKKQIIK